MAFEKGVLAFEKGVIAFSMWPSIRSSLRNPG
jgi:hypothetical protein